MITLSQVYAEVEDLRRICASKTSKPREKKRARDRITFCNSVADYLTAGASEDYVKREIAKLDKSIKVRQESFEGWLSSQPTAVHIKFKTVPVAVRNKFNKVAGIDKLRTHLKTLKYIAHAD